MNPVVPSSPFLARAMSIDGVKGGWTDRFFKRNKIRPSASIEDVSAGYDSDTCNYHTKPQREAAAALVRSNSRVMGHAGVKLEDYDDFDDFDDFDEADKDAKDTAKIKAIYRKNRSNSLLMSAIERSASFVTKRSQKRSGIRKAVEAMATGKDSDSDSASATSSPRFGKVGLMTSAAVAKMRVRKKSYRLSVPAGQEFGSNPDFLDLFPEIRREVHNKLNIPAHASASLLSFCSLK